MGGGGGVPSPTRSIVQVSHHCSVSHFLHCPATSQSHVIVMVFVSLFLCLTMCAHVWQSFCPSLSNIYQNFVLTLILLMSKHTVSFVF